MSNDKNNEISTEQLKQLLSQIPQDELEKQANRELGKRSLYQFFLQCMENVYNFDFIDNWHYKVICDILQKEVERIKEKKKTDKHLLINLPTRCGKTHLISEIFPVWLWLQNPAWDIMNVCSTQSLATKSSRFSKLIIESDWFQNTYPDEISLSSDNKAKTDYTTSRNGTRTSFGIKSSTIGRGFDVLIIDDPNDPKEANSDTSLKKVQDTYKDVLTGRGNNSWSLRIILQQRVSENDLCGYLLQENPNDYYHICIPAELSDNTTKGFEKYYQDGLFFPARFNKKVLDSFKRERTPSGYASQLMQFPAALEGEILVRSWFKIISQLEYQKLTSNYHKKYMFVDTAFTADKGNDASGILICSTIQKRIIIQNGSEYFLEFNNLLNKIKEYISLYRINTIYIEGKANGLSIAQELKRQLTGKTLVKILTPQGSKKERAISIQPYLINDKVQLVEDHWNKYFLEQLANFPYGKRDEFIDLLYYAVNELIAKDFMNRKLEDSDDPYSKENIEEYRSYHEDLFDELY